MRGAPKTTASRALSSMARSLAAQRNAPRTQTQRHAAGIVTAKRPNRWRVRQWRPAWPRAVLASPTGGGEVGFVAIGGVRASTGSFSAPALPDALQRVSSRSDTSRRSAQHSIRLEPIIGSMVKPGFAGPRSAFRETDLWFHISLIRILGSHGAAGSMM